MYETAWGIFANVLGKREMVRLDHYNGGYQYRIPAAGVAIVNGAVAANLQVPGLTIRYTTNGKEPDVKSKLYTGPVKEKGVISFKVFDTRGRSSRTTTVVNKSADMKPGALQ
jgi:hexosaminidase